MNTYTPKHGEVVNWKRNRDFLSAQLLGVEQVTTAGKHRATGRHVGRSDYRQPNGTRPAGRHEAPPRPYGAWAQLHREIQKAHHENPAN